MMDVKPEIRTGYLHDEVPGKDDLLDLILKLNQTLLLLTKFGK